MERWQCGKRGCPLMAELGVIEVLAELGSVEVLLTCSNCERKVVGKYPELQVLRRRVPRQSGMKAVKIGHG